MNKISKYLCFNDSVRMFLVDSKEALNEIRKIHDMWGTASYALGTVMNIALVLQAMEKNNERIGITINSNSHIGKILVETNKKNNIKAFVSNPHISFKDDNNQISLKHAIGNQGHIEIYKDIGLKEPYISSTPIVSGDLVDDFVYFFANSEQINTAILNSIKINPDNNEILTSYGLVCQVLPNTDDSVIDNLEKELLKINDLSNFIIENKNIDELIGKITNNNYKKLEETNFKYECDCSKEKFEVGLKQIGKEELVKILEEDGKCTVTCHYCLKEYNIDSDNLKKIISYCQ